ncbi:MAG: ubiquinone/menaquinone biosynthesis methyltransferase [Bacteroidales bacterium]
MGLEKKDYPLHDFYKKIYQRYDLVNRIFTFGQDVKWRKKAVAECLRNNPGKVLDICTGTGDLILEISASAEKTIQLTGYDFSAEMLEKATEKSKKRGGSIDFIQGDVAAMPFQDNFFDTAGISFGIRNLVYKNSNAAQHLAEIHRVLRLDGRLVILESSKPENRIWRFFNGLYLRFILPYLGGVISGNLKAYRYLASSSENYYSRSEMGEIMNKAGFRIAGSQSLFFGSVMLVIVEKQAITGTNYSGSNR